MIVVVTGGDQDKHSISDAVKREITQGLQEGHGADKGIAVAGVRSGSVSLSVFFDFETCKVIGIPSQNVRCMAC